MLYKIEIPNTTFSDAQGAVNFDKINLTLAYIKNFSPVSFLFIPAKNETDGKLIKIYEKG